MSRTRATHPSRAEAFYLARSRTGELVDVYRSAWLDSALRSGALRVSPHAIASAPAPTGRFLLLALDPNRKGTRIALRLVWKALADFVDAPATSGIGNKHNPDFLFFNTHTGQILAFGLGRKGKDFLFAIERSGRTLGSPRDVAGFLGSPTPFKAVFTEGDTAGAVPFLLTQFARLSEGWQSLGPLPMYPDQAKARLRCRDDEYSRAELSTFLDAGMRAEEMIRGAERHFRELFAGCALLSWELNPEDF